MKTTQNKTGLSAELESREKLISLGLNVYKPIPDKGVDIIAQLEGNNKIVKIQVKGKLQKDPRWFQMRITSNQIKDGIIKNKTEDQIWFNNVNKVDFWILVSFLYNEHWVLPSNKLEEIIKINNQHYYSRRKGSRLFEEPIRNKQIEINLDLPYKGATIKDNYLSYLNNYENILGFITGN